MKKKGIRLTESQFKNIITNSVSKILKEYLEPYELQDPDDLSDIEELDLSDEFPEFKYDHPDMEYDEEEPDFEWNRNYDNDEVPRQEKTVSFSSMSDNVLTPKYQQGTDKEENIEEKIVTDSCCLFNVIFNKCSQGNDFYQIVWTDNKFSPHAQGKLAKFAESGRDEEVGGGVTYCPVGLESTKQFFYFPNLIKYKDYDEWSKKEVVRSYHFRGYLNTKTGKYFHPNNKKWNPETREYEPAPDSTTADVDDFFGNL